MGIFGKANKEPKEPDGQEPATTAEPNPDGSSAIAQASAKADADNVVNLATEAAKKAASEAATQAIEGERKRAAGINDLCKLAKRPDLAGELIASGKSVEEARAALAESADNGDEISSFVNGAKPGNAADRTERLKANCEKRLERINARRKAGF